MIATLNMEKQGYYQQTVEQIDAEMKLVQAADIAIIPFPNIK